MIDEQEYYKFHQELIGHLNPKKGLEIGCGKGLSALAFLDSCNGTLVSVDVDPSCEGSFIKNQRFKFLCGESPNIVRTIPTTFDYIYIDGDKRSMHVYWDASAAFLLLSIGGVIVFDDTENVWCAQVNFGIRRFLEDNGMMANEFCPELDAKNPHGSRFFRKQIV